MNSGKVTIAEMARLVWADFTEIDQVDCICWRVTKTWLLWEVYSYGLLYTATYYKLGVMKQISPVITLLSWTFVTLFYCLALTTAKLRPNVRGFTATHMTLRSCRSNPASLIKKAACPVHIFFSEIYLTNYEKICDFSFHLLSIFIWAKVKSDWCSHI